MDKPCSAPPSNSESAVHGAETHAPSLAGKAKELEAVLAEHPELMVIIDGTERPIRRPKDKDDQKRDYRGKKKAHRQKKAHRKKNLVVSSRRKIAYLGATSPGSVHDKKLADESGLVYPPGTILLKDSAFQGHEAPGTETLQPKKKPRAKVSADQPATSRRHPSH